jgi:hypothetical protein
MASDEITLRQAFKQALGATIDGLKKGSERESVKPLILGRILQNHEFGPAGRHVLGLQQQVA